MKKENKSNRGGSGRKRTTKYTDQDKKIIGDWRKEVPGQRDKEDGSGKEERFPRDEKRSFTKPEKAWREDKGDKGSRDKSDNTGRGGDRKYGDRPERGDDKPFRKSNDSGRDRKYGDDKKSYGKSDRPERGGDRKYGDRKERGDDKPFRKSNDSDRDRKYGDDKKSYGKSDRPERGGDRKYGDRNERDEKKSFRKSTDSDRSRKFGDDKKSYGKSDRPVRGGDRKFGDRTERGDDKPFRKSNDSGRDRKYGDDKKSYDKTDRPARGGDRKFGDRTERGDDKPFRKSNDSGRDRKFGDDKKSYGNSDRPARGGDRNYGEREERGEKKPFRKSNDSGKEGKFKDDKKSFDKPARTINRDKEEEKDFTERSENKSRGKKISKPAISHTEPVRLNRYIANSGLCSRREADELILAGYITINQEVVKEMGTKVNPGDEVRYKGRLIVPEAMVYVLMNKPKDCITTTDDPEGRKTVMDIISGEIKERILPVGRLDRNTTGILLLTNDGDLAQKLSHPSFGVHKVYKATLNKPLAKPDLEALLKGFELEDGFIQADSVAYAGDDKSEVGIEIHSGKNHIIHRMFNHLDYLVDKLDRVSYAGLSKDGLKRGEFRELTEKEVNYLRKNSGKTGK